ncbi:unnamed protein product [Schistosoma mattheei]|uniref:Uncharacterized protein n=1 Tax=Schistosoma mattheei TaxID=31246 RepID=A0A183PXY2_9TREM|nr:unnamed protein product [Schistosoma mattheei]
MLEKHCTTGQTGLQRFNSVILRDTDKLNEFKITLNNRLQTLHDPLKEEEVTMEDNCKGIKEALTSTYQEVLGRKKHYHNEVISIETVHKIQERNNKKTAFNNSRTKTENLKAQVEYTEANKKVKKSVRADKQEYVEELAKAVEKAETEGNAKHLYDTTKKLARKYCKAE